LASSTEAQNPVLPETIGARVPCGRAAFSPRIQMHWITAVGLSGSRVEVRQKRDTPPPR